MPAFPHVGQVATCQARSLGFLRSAPHHGTPGGITPQDGTQGIFFNTDSKESPCALQEPWTPAHAALRHCMGGKLGPEGGVGPHSDSH